MSPVMVFNHRHLPQVFRPLLSEARGTHEKTRQVKPAGSALRPDEKA